jgi:4,5-DOPA dioxygenase extradiol
MKRSTFIKTLAAMPIAGAAYKLAELQKVIDPLEPTKRMPVLFLGHGSPMNAIEENEFVSGFRDIGKGITEKPKAIVCISAHWETRGTFVTAMEKPRTIHDFGGFPKELFAVQYPAPGSPETAKAVTELVKKTTVSLDTHEWGLDHGAWSVIKHLYPDADVPVIQMSIDRTQSAQYHYELAQELSALRDKGILVVGSGNMVHNLGMVAWDKFNEKDYAYDWAREASEKMKNSILDGDHQPLIDFKKQGKSFDLAIPTPEHFLPLLYVLGIKGKDEEVSLFNDKAMAGSLTMTSVKIG